MTMLSRRELALALAAVGGGAALSVAPAPSRAQARRVRVALGDVISVETLCNLIAMERVKERGITYEMISFSKEELAIQAVVNGQADIGIGTPYSLIQKSRANLKIMFQVSRLVFFPVVDKQRYKTWKDLDGKPFVFHARGTGTEAIGNIIAKREGIRFGERSYVPGSENRIIAMMNGQIHATIIDLANKEVLMQKAGDRFIVLPGLDSPASDETLFAGDAYIAANRETVNVVVEEHLKLWREMARDPAMIEAERKKRNLIADQPKQVLDDVVPFYVRAIKEGVFSPVGGNADVARADFDFYVEAGQMQGPANTLKVEDFWDLGPLNAARSKLGA